MAKIGTQVQGEFTRGPLIAKGEHVLKLVSCETKRVTSQYSKEEDGKVDKFVWSFISNRKDERGEPYEHAIFTGTKYGNERASLTNLLDMMVPGIDIDAASDMDTNELLGSRYNVLIKHTKDPGSDRMFANHVYIAPLRGAGVSPTNAVTEEAESAEDDEELAAPAMPPMVATAGRKAERAA